MKIRMGWSALFFTFVLAAAGQSPPAAVNRDYLIGPLDVLNIDVFQQPEFSRAVPVRPDGKITLPLINDVQAAGLTPEQLAAEITKLLGKYVTKPRVSVIVAQINSRVIYIGGEINHPGTLPLLSSMTVLQAIFLGGGAAASATGQGRPGTDRNVVTPLSSPLQDTSTTLSSSPKDLSRSLAASILIGQRHFPGGDNGSYRWKTT